MCLSIDDSVKTNLDLRIIRTTNLMYLMNVWPYEVFHSWLVYWSNSLYGLETYPKTCPSAQFVDIVWGIMLSTNRVPVPTGSEE